MLLKPIFPILLGSLLFVSGAHALTFKSGQVLGADGKIYDGASPGQAENIAATAGKESFFGTRKTAGVIGQSLYVVIEGKATFIPLDQIRGKSRAQVKEVVKTFVVANALGLDISELNAANEGYLNAIESRLAGAEILVEDGFSLEEAVEWDDTIAGATDEASKEAVIEAFEAAHQAVTDSYPEIEGSVWDNIDGEMICAENCGKDGSGLARPGN